jgi:hypothetical protein
MPCGYRKNRSFGGTCASIIRVTRIGELVQSVSSQRASVASYGYVPSSPILVTLTMEATSSLKRRFLTKATQCNIPEDGILHSHRRENLKSFILNYFSQNNDLSALSNKTKEQTPRVSVREQTHA